jgi:hypothetical protein
MLRQIGLKRRRERGRRRNREDVAYSVGGCRWLWLQVDVVMVYPPTAAARWRRDTDANAGVSRGLWLFDVTTRRRKKARVPAACSSFSGSHGKVASNGLYVQT